MVKKPKKKSVHPYLVELGLTIKRHRQNRKLSLETLGGEIGIDGSNLQKIELGHNITISTLLKICICLKTSPVTLLKEVKWDLTDHDLERLSVPKTIKKRAVKTRKASKK